MIELRDYFIAHAPEWPQPWFEKDFVFKETEPNKGLPEWQEWNTRRQRAMFFAWRIYYADMLILERNK